MKNLNLFVEELVEGEPQMETLYETIQKTVNEARGKSSAAQKKKMQAAQKKINKIVSNGLEEYFAPGNYDDEGEEGRIRGKILGDIGEIIARL
jgi:molecular chaperone DnaK (HSP70)